MSTEPRDPDYNDEHLSIDGPRADDEPPDGAPIRRQAHDDDPEFDPNMPPAFNPKAP